MSLIERFSLLTNDEPDCAATSAVHSIEQRIGNAWPELQCDRGEFERHVLALRETAPRQVSVESLAIEDLLLAFACGQQDKAALRIFSREYEPDLKAIASKFHISAPDLDDVRQVIWDKLFVGANGVPKKILDYKGEGRLRHWFRAVATRAVLDRLRRARPNDERVVHSDIGVLAHSAPQQDPELSAVRARYGSDFREAFEFAVLALEPEERNAIRCHYLLGMTSDQMAVALSMHRATAARKVVRAREKLLKMTRERLRSRLGANNAELESIMHLFGEGLSISLSRILQ